MFMQVLIEVELFDGKNKVIIYNNVGYVWFFYVINFVGVL